MVKDRKGNSEGLTLDEFLGMQAAAKARIPKKTDVKVEVAVRPPPKAVKTVRELICWEYAKLMARSAGFDKNYGFIMNRYMKLKNGEIKFAGLDKDIREQMKEERCCIYCGSKENLSEDHIIPVSKGGPDTPTNIVVSCLKCNMSKKDKDIFEWYYIFRKEQEIPKRVWSKYLKLVWHFHSLHGTLDDIDINQDGTLNVLDLGAIFKATKR